MPGPSPRCRHVLSLACVGARLPARGPGARRASIHAAQRHAAVRADRPARAHRSAHGVGAGRLDGRGGRHIGRGPRPGAHDVQGHEDGAARTVLAPHRRVGRTGKRVHQPRLHGLLPADSREALAEVMRLEADRFAHNQWPDAEFSKEIEVIKEERRMRTDDQPRAAPDGAAQRRRVHGVSPPAAGGRLDERPGCDDAGRCPRVPPPVVRARERRHRGGRRRGPGSRPQARRGHLRPHSRSGGTGAQAAHRAGPARPAPHRFQGARGTGLRRDGVPGARAAAAGAAHGFRPRCAGVDDAFGRAQRLRRRTAGALSHAGGRPRGRRSGQRCLRHGPGAEPVPVERRPRGWQDGAAGRGPRCGPRWPAWRAKGWAMPNSRA